MKAIQCHKFGPIDQLSYDEVSVPKLGYREVLIDVRSIGVNFPDLLLVKGMYQSQPDFPFIPGTEVAGVVTMLGEGVEFLKVGDQVATQMRTGAYSERVASDERSCHTFEHADFKHASSFLVTYGTSYHALKDRAKLKKGETVAVLGAAGGVGLAAVELSKKMGATVIACASTDEKLEQCRASGADHLVNYTTTPLRNAFKEIVGRRGIDVIVDPVGGAYAELGVRSMAFGGRYLVIGFTAGQIPKIPLNLPLLKACSIVGVFWGRFLVENSSGARENHNQLMTWIDNGELKPFVQKTYPLGDAIEAMRWVEGRQVMGKVVLVP